MKKKSWKTTAGGAGAILVGLLMAFSALTGVEIAGMGTEASVGTAIGLVLAGITGLFSRDDNVTSEDAGAK